MDKECEGLCLTLCFYQYLTEESKRIIDVLNTPSLTNLIAFDFNSPNANRLGYYDVTNDVIHIKADLVPFALKEWLELKRIADSSKKYFLELEQPITSHLSTLLRVLCHELKHREQHFHLTQQNEAEFLYESQLDLNNPDDYKKYLELSIEIDAEAFGYLGASYLLNEFFNLDSTYYFNIGSLCEKYVKRIHSLFTKYKSKFIDYRGAIFEKKYKAMLNRLLEYLEQ